MLFKVEANGKSTSQMHHKGGKAPVAVKGQSGGGTKNEANVWNFKNTVGFFFLHASQTVPGVQLKSCRRFRNSKIEMCLSIQGV